MNEARFPLLLTPLFLASCAALGADPTLPVDRTAELDGIRIHYEDAGRGDEALVLIHGWS